MNIPAAFELALQHHQSGRLAEAEALYRQILAADPWHADAVHHLGILAHQLGRNDVAADYFRQVVALAPHFFTAHDHLGSALRALGKIDAALAAYQHAIALAPHEAELHFHLGNALHDGGRLDEAIVSFRQAVALQPGHEAALGNLANTLQVRGRLDEAIATYQRLLVLNPRSADALCNLSVALTTCRRSVEAVTTCRQAIALRPDYPEAHYNLGVALAACGQSDEAIAAYQQALAIRPDLHQALSNLSGLLRDKGQTDEAIAACERAIAICPGHVEAHNNLGNSLKDAGRIDEAVAAYRRVLALRPEAVDTHSNLLLTLHYHPGLTGPAIAEEHRAWNRLHAGTAGGAQRRHENDRSPDRRLRIGYVSADFRQHPVGQFFLPLLTRQERENFEIYCYSQVVSPDSMTERIRTHADGWGSLSGLTADQGADRIREDRIDILVDLSGHTANHRLLVFARKPAPVQVTWLGYPNTTGLSAMDYRLTDALADPPGLTDADYSEKLVRLPACAWCYEPGHRQEIAPAREGPITFGCFNNSAKITDPMLATWARILRAVPTSRLLLKARGFGSESSRARVWRTLSAAGIHPERVELRAFEPDEAAHLRCYGRVDIALDTSPYHGTTTTCEALWMGVPVVTLAGDTHASRVGVSLLGSAGLSECVADSTERYVALAVALAGDRPRLAGLRAGLRERMLASPLMNAPRFARDVEAAFREMWRRWCANESATTR